MMWGGLVVLGVGLLIVAAVDLARGDQSVAYNVALLSAGLVLLVGAWVFVFNGVAPRRSPGAGPEDDRA
jgi:hypothetical protein